MAETTKKYVGQAALQHLIEKLGIREDTKDAAILASSKEYANGLADNYDPAGKAAELVKALEDGKVKTNADAITKLNGGVEVEGSVDKKVADMATTLRGEITGNKYDDTALKGRVSANEAALQKLNGTGEGSVSKSVADAVAAIVNGAPEAYDTLKEISDWISGHASDASGMNSSIKANKADIDALKELVGTLPEGEDSRTIIEYIDRKVGVVDFTEAIATAKQEAIAAAAVDAKTKADTALKDAKAYANGLASNYATAAQGTKADSAVQKADVVTGKTNGTIAVQGTDVAVRGLGSAAYTPVTDYEKAGAVAKLENGQVTENKNAIAANASEITTAKARIQALEDVKFVAITNEEIDGYFTAAPQA